MWKRQKKPADPTPSSSNRYPAVVFGAVYGLAVSVGFAYYETGVLVPKIFIAVPTVIMLTISLCLGIKDASQYPLESQDCVDFITMKHCISILIIPVIAILIAKYLPPYDHTITAFACIAAGAIISQAFYQVGRNSRPKPETKDDDETKTPSQPGNYSE